ncbi:oxysterol-binding protein 1 isoform X4 [Hetaerina americana]|uniref:oxysterol-binding protein 1 isoform X4 n=1 Tax=Hetaerina americana TaxID=62018 RepID=UPI003A7F3BC8
MTEGKGSDTNMKGWLLKWTNYLKGYQRRYFVLSNGMLSYYRAEYSGGTKLSIRRRRRSRVEVNQAEVMHTCRGSISLHGAIIHTEESCSFVISNGGTQTFHIKAFTEVERQRWVTALELAKAQAIHLIESDAHHSSPSDEDEENEFYDAMEETQSNFILTIPTGHRRTSSGMSNASQASDGCNPPDGHDEASGSSSEVDEVGGETTTVCVITAKSAEDPGPTGYQTPGGKKQSDSASPSSSVPPSPTSTAASSIGGAAGSSTQVNGSVVTSRRKRRTRVPDKPNYPLNLWSIMKNCIGQELSKIPMPVNFSEPLSMLQRLTEDYEYADILDKAAACCPDATGGDSCEQLAYVAAFTVSSYSTTSNRTGKPFNPLLGETYECDRTDDFGWRSISEQVSHHPPMVAQYCEGKDWRCWQEFTMASKFRGKYLQVIPLGTSHLEFNASGNHYTWRKVTTTVHNIIVGKLWVDQSGDMDIVNHKTGDKCHLKYIPYSYFTRDVQRKVKGCVVDKDGNVKWVVTGMWDNKIEIAKVTSSQGGPENPVFKTGPSRLVWKRRMPASDSERYYNFTELACQLNEEEEGVCPTDSRNRPDQRLMEQGLWDEANAEKLRLEEKQRAARRSREAEAEKAASDEEIRQEWKGRPYPPYEPVWFKKQTEPYTGKVFHVYQGKYWENKDKGDWSMCPDIF